MGRAINDRKDIDRLKIEMKELQDVVAELSQALVNTKQIHHLDDEEFTPPVGKRKKTTKVEKSNTETEKSSAEA